MGDTADILEALEEKGKDIHKKRSSDEQLLKIKSELSIPIPFKKARYAWQIKKSTVTGSQTCKLVNDESNIDMACSGEMVNETKSEINANEVKHNSNLSNDAIGNPLEHGSSDGSCTGLLSKINCDMETHALSKVSGNTNKDQDVFSFDSVKPKVANAFCCFRGVTGIQSGPDTGSDDEYDSDNHEQIACDSDKIQEEVRLQVLQSCFSHNTENNRTILEASYLRQPGSIRVDLQGPVFDDTSPTDSHSAATNCLWQKQEIACSIVDNVFNHTLEEMGISPDPKMNRLATQRLTLENQSIQAVIRQQGLQVLGHWDNVIEGTDPDLSETFTSCTDEHFTEEEKTDASCDNEMEVDLTKADSEVAENAECGIMVQEKSEREKGKETDSFEMNVSPAHKSELTIGEDNQLVNVEETPLSMNPFIDESVKSSIINNKLSINCNSDIQTASDRPYLPVDYPEEIAERSGDYDEKTVASDPAVVTAADDAVTDETNVLDLAVSTAILTQGLTMTDSWM